MGSPTSNDWGAYSRRRAQRDTQRRLWEDRGKTGVMQQQAQEHQGLLGAAKGLEEVRKDSPQGLQSAWPYWNLDLRPLASGMVRE